MNMDEIMEDALEEYEYYYSDFESDDSDIVANALHDALMTNDYRNCPYLNNALQVYYQLTNNSYHDSTNAKDKHDYQQILSKLNDYASQHHLKF